MRCSRGQGWGWWSSINICRRLASREVNSSQPKLRFGWEASSARVPVWLVTYNLETGHTISFQPTVHRLWRVMTVNSTDCSSFLPVMCDAALFEFSSPVGHLGNSISICRSTRHWALPQPVNSYVWCTQIWNCSVVFYFILLYTSAWRACLLPAFHSMDSHQNYS